MKFVTLIKEPAVALLWLTVFSCIVQGAVLTKKRHHEIENGQKPKLLQHPNNLASPIWSLRNTTFGLEEIVLQQSTISITTIFNHVSKKLKQSKSPVQVNKLLGDIFEGVSNDDCKGHILEWMLRIENADGNVNLFSDKEKWVLQILDSWGKLPEGILSGHINALGDFDECVQIEVSNLDLLNEEPEYQEISQDFKGRYCTSYLVDYDTNMEALGPLSLKPDHQAERSLPKAELQKAVSAGELLELMFTQVGAGVIIPSIAMCMPNSCSQTDIHVFFTNVLFNYYSSIPDLDPEKQIYPLVATCRDKAMPDLSAADIAMIVILSTFVGLGLGAGILDYYWQHRRKENNAAQQQVSTAKRYLMAFSIYTNTKKWLSTRKSSEDLGCLHGLRFLSTCWVVLGHTYDVFGAIPAWNLFDMIKLYESPTIMPILNGTFSVDTFFVMSGMLATYSILKMLDKTKGKFNVIMFYIHRYIRLTPTYAILVGIMATLVVYMGNGPSWEIIDMQAKFCRDNWWTNLLYINNIVKIREMCNGQSWYLSNDFQYYLLSPFIVYPLWKWPKAGLGLLSLYTMASLISPVLIVRYADAPPAALITIAALDDGFYEIYFRPWARIQTFIVGVWLGWVVYKTRGKRINIPRIVVVALWLFSTALALAVIYGIRDWFDPTHEIPEVAGYFYAALSRFSWGLVISWVIFACIKGYGGIVNSFLSWKVFMPLGRLTFCVYLTSFNLQLIFHARLSVPLKYDTYTMVNLFLAHLAMSLMVGFLCTVLFESPFIILHKLIFDGGASSKPQLQAKKTDDKNGESIKGPTKRYGIFYEKEDTIINTPLSTDENLNAKEAKD